MQALTKDVKLVLLDVGNTLLFVDYPYLARAAQSVGARLSARAIRQAEAHARVEVDRVVQGTDCGTDASRWRQYYKTMLTGAGLEDGLFDRLEPILRRRHDETGLWILVRPWTKPVLARLREAGYRLAVVSNADGRVESWLRKKGMARHFDAILDSRVVGIEKPDPRIFEMALDRTGFAPHQAIHVGDLYSVDVLGARKAGVTPILLDPLGLHPASDCLKIRRLSELLRMLPGTHDLRPGRRHKEAATREGTPP
ncbi:MAG: HAD-IA family hydrolase [Candidatus Riflebacteria bacterium]|nr:HAD-IA family hydrolase [Candidatus Riflebacteria bacterium]